MKTYPGSMLQWLQDQRAACGVFYRKKRREIVEIPDRGYEGSRDPGRSEIDCFKVKSREGQVFMLRRLCLFDA